MIGRKEMNGKKKKKTKSLQLGQNIFLMLPNLWCLILGKPLNLICSAIDWG